MKQDHTPDGSQPEELDAFVEELHQDLQPEAWQGWRNGVPRLPERKPQRAKLWIAVAASLLLALGVTRPWQVAEQPGYLAELIATSNGSTSVQQRRTLRRGEHIETGPEQSARIEVADLGQLELDVDSLLRVGDASEIDGEHYLRLERGAVTASIFASPRIFQLGTPGGIAVDLGCVYRAEIEGDGRTRVTVVAGAVSLEAMGSKVYVPQGASVWSRDGAGPGTPIQDEANAELRGIVTELDASASLHLDLETFRRMFELASPADSLSIWHLMMRARGSDRMVYAKLLDRLVPMPEGYEAEECVRAGSAGNLAWRKLQPWS